MNHALGFTGGPGGEHHHGHIVGAQGGSLARFPARPGRENRAFETRVILTVDNDQMFQMM